MTQIVDPTLGSHLVNVYEHASFINTLSSNIASNTASMQYQQLQKEPDLKLIDELKQLIDSTIEKLKEVWAAAKTAGEDFLAEVYGIVKGFFVALYADLEKFLEFFGITI